MRKKKEKEGRVFDGISIEFMVDRDDGYKDVLVWSLPPKPIGHKLTLLSAGVAVINEVEGWTVGGYMKQLHRGPSNT